MAVIDGKNAVLGRLASATARKLLSGEEVVIVNAEKVIITGDPNGIVKKYLERRIRGSPQHGPFFPRQPNMIVKRTIRGMVPYKTARGRNAMKKLRVHVGVPEDYKDKKLDNFSAKVIRSNYITVGEVAKTIGWHG